MVTVEPLSLTALIPHVIVRADGCWIWQRAVNRSGYGVTRLPGYQHPKMVHRVAWAAINGPIPEGHEIDHMCNVRVCCNPNHLQPVLPDENKRLAAERRAAKRPVVPDLRPPSGSIRVRGTRHAVVYRVYMPDGSKRQTSKTFATNAEAQEFLASLPNRPYLAKRKAA
jgi:hypothetical protein